MNFSFPYGRTLLAITLAAYAAALPAIASDIDEEIVLTATRTIVPLADAMASVSVISRDDLNAQKPVDLVDVFRQTPSLDISRSGGYGSSTSLFTRGTASDHTLILVDGQRVSSATLGSTNFQFVNPDQIERIEVVRGAFSSLYGSEAIGGVIQVFTRDGSGNSGSYLSTARGTDNLSKMAVGTSGNAGGWRYGVHASYLETDGIDSLEVDSGFNRDRDGYRNKSLNTSVGYRFGNGADIALRFIESNSRKEYDSASNPAARPYGDSLLQNVNLSGSLPVTDFWSSKLSIGQSTDDSDNYDAATGLNTGNFRTQREQLFWQNDLTLTEGHVLTLGYDYYEDAVEGSKAYQETSRDNSALLAQYQASWSVVDLILGLREDDNEEFGVHTTGNVAFGLKLGERHKVIASWSEGFKAPTFNDLYWPVGSFSAGNPDLKPEQSENAEISLRGDYQTWYWSLAYFENTVENLINWAPGPDFVWRPYNVSDAEIQGAELIAGTTIIGWQVDASVSYVEPRDADTDNILIKRSRSNLTLNADRDFGNWQMGFSVKSQSRRFTDSANTDSIGGYTTFGVRLGYRLTGDLEASLKADNLFDKDYRLNKGYNHEGRSWQLGLTYQL